MEWLVGTGRLDGAGRGGACEAVAAWALAAFEASDAEKLRAPPDADLAALLRREMNKLNKLIQFGFE